MLEFGGSNTSEQQNELCGGLCWLNQRCWRDVGGRERMGRGGGGGWAGVSWTRFFFLIHFVLISSKGGSSLSANLRRRRIEVLEGS